MKSLKTIFILYFCLQINIPLFASEIDPNDLNTREAQIFFQTVNEFKVNASIENYLKNNDKIAKLILFCNSNIDSQNIGTINFELNQEIHIHRGWYNVSYQTYNQLNFQGTLDNIFMVNTWDLIFVENSNYLTDLLVRQLFGSLKSKGAIVFDAKVLYQTFKDQIIDSDEEGNESEINYITANSFRTELFPVLEYYSLVEPNKFLDEQLIPQINNLEDMETFLKGYLSNNIGFKQVNLYIDTIFNQTWVQELHNKIRDFTLNMSLYLDAQVKLNWGLFKRERKKEIEKTFFTVSKGDLSIFKEKNVECQKPSKGYCDYSLSLVKIGFEPIYCLAKLPSTYVICIKE